MTLDTVLVRAYLKELHALGRLRRAIAGNPDIDGDWTYCLAAMDEQMRRLRELLAHDDQNVVRACEAQLDDERQTDPPEYRYSGEVATGCRIH